MNTKKCNKCQLDLPTTEFYKHSGRSPDGFEYNCKKCHAIHKNLRYHKNPEIYKKSAYAWKSKNKVEVAKKLLAYKTKVYSQCQEFKKQISTDYGCLICKENRAGCLDFHHINATDKIKEVGKCANLTDLFREMSNCIILCANCHRLYHRDIIKLPENLTRIDVTKYIPADFKPRKLKFIQGYSPYDKNPNYPLHAQFQ